MMKIFHLLIFEFGMKTALRFLFIDIVQLHRFAKDFINSFLKGLRHFFSN